MRNSYGCVVIGSGYGGAVAASRMARAVRPDCRRPTVCVLERGRERWPGEYPSGFSKALKDLHVSGEFAPGSAPGKVVEESDPTGIYRLIFGNGLSAVVGNGESEDGSRFFSFCRHLQRVHESRTFVWVRDWNGIVD
jgi:choline dehydrogenase-like flavoprotein